MTTTTNLPTSTPILKLARLLGEIAAKPEFRSTSTYASIIADLMAAHDLLREFGVGTDDNRRAYAVAKKIYDNARIYAAKNGFAHPNVILREAGYSV